MFTESQKKHTICTISTISSIINYVEYAPLLSYHRIYQNYYIDFMKPPFNNSESKIKHYKMHCLIRDKIF